MYPGAHVAATPDKPALVMADTGETVTYAELEERSVRLAHFLHDQGLRVGDSFALLSENSLRYHECYWAALRSGLYLTALSFHLSLDEQLFILRDCGARVLVVSATMADWARAIAEAVPEIDVRVAFGGDIEGYGGYEAVLQSSSPVPFDHQPAGRDMQYSSGTTGLPKGVRAPLPERQVTEPGDQMVAVFAPVYGFDADTVYLSPAPLYHAAPLRFCGLVTAVGGTVVIMPRFEPAKALEHIETYHATHSQWGPVLHEYYAATEAAGITLIRPEEWLERPGSVGRAGLGVLHVCDEATRDQEELPTGEVGLVYFERDEMPFSYHNDPEKTRSAQHPHHDTWASTGDLGWIDDDGYLFLTDRRAFMIISGGVNIYPQEVENALTMHPKVFDVAVIGLPDDEMGEQVKAVVQPADGVEPGPELAQELIDHVRASIAHFKAPRSVDFVTALPRTATGKLQKRKVQQAYLEQENTP